MATHGRLCGLCRYIVYPYPTPHSSHNEIGGSIVFPTNTHADIGTHSVQTNKINRTLTQKLFIFFCVTFLGRFCFATRISQSLLAILCLFSIRKMKNKLKAKKGDKASTYFTNCFSFIRMSIGSNGTANSMKYKMQWHFRSHCRVALLPVPMPLAWKRRGKNRWKHNLNEP